LYHLALTDPRPEYLRRREEWRSQAARCAAQSEQFSTWRGLIGLALLIAAFGAWHGWWSPGGILLPIAAFAVVAILHERLTRRERAAERVASYFDRGLERVAGNWQGRGSAGEVFRDPAHVYADDLDLFGAGSLFELISVARTLPGEAMLADWLKAPAPVDVALARQQAVEDLRARVDLRQDIAMTGDDARAELHAETLRKWGVAPPVPFFAGAAWALPVIAAINLVSLIGWALSWWPIHFPLLGVFFAALLGWLCRDSIFGVTSALGARPKDLALLGAIMQRLEGETFTAPRLVALRTLLIGAAAEIARLELLVELLDSGRNQFFAALAFYLLWTPQFSWRIETWRRKNGASLGQWIDAVAELEALSSLAGFAFEHPAATFPVLRGDGSLFAAEALAHPLISESKAVPNSLRFGDETRLLMISGSNMSGKSTLLRAVGLNTVLAWAGAPVRAASLTISPMALGASIRATDSLLEGRSRFYAEILRLRQIQKLTTGPRPALFLLDELLSGTNSHDREIGAGNFLNGLVARGAVGLATTHDLALTQVAERMGSKAANCHLADTIREGEVLFDYTLRPGVVQRGNALALMRAVGLEIS
jgi:hypothetical protein